MHCNEEQQRQDVCDDLKIGGLKIFQSRNGYRFSIDPVLLCDFTHISSAAHVVDLGTGSGIIPLILAHWHDKLKITGIECQPAMVERARRSVKLNKLEDRIDILEADVRQLPDSLVPASFAAVLTNPPYRSADTGRIAPEDERAAARHELAGDFVDFLRAASFLLKNGGKFYVIFLAERLAELMSEMRTFRLEPKRLRMVHSREGKTAKLVLVEGRKNGKPGVQVEPPLVIYKGEGRDYTEEVLEMYKNGDE